MNGHGEKDRVTEETLTYRNSCLVVLVGEVGKSSSLPVREAEKYKKMTDRENRGEQRGGRQKRGKLSTEKTFRNCHICCDKSVLLKRHWKERPSEQKQIQEWLLTTLKYDNRRECARNKLHLKSRFKRCITKAAWLKLEPYFTFLARVMWVVPRIVLYSF